MLSTGDKLKWKFHTFLFQSWKGNGKEYLNPTKPHILLGTVSQQVNMCITLADIVHIFGLFATEVAPHMVPSLFLRWEQPSFSLFDVF